MTQWSGTRSRPRPRTGRMRTLGFTDAVDVLLEACDVMVSKAGGLTCSEALVKQVPLVIFKPTPGQEDRNADYLVSAGAARHANTVEEVAATVSGWLARPDELARVREAVGRIARPEAAATIARRVLEGITRGERRRA